MDKRVIFAVAGSGKTTHIIEELDESKRALIITYTVNNYSNLKAKLIGEYGFLPQNIRIYTYFTFLYSFCYKPFCFIQYGTKGINYTPNRNKFAKDTQRFIDKHKRLYSNRITKFFEYNNITNAILRRIEKYFDFIFIDEVQDYAGHDFNFLKQLSNANINILFVGDFYQHTYDTSRDGNVNSTLHDDYSLYKSKYEVMGLAVDTNSLLRSYRCSPTVCEFITNNLGIEIHSHNENSTEVILLTEPNEIRDIISSTDVVKLFYDKHYTYNIFSSNWGECKGIDHYNDVCVVLNKTASDFHRNDSLIDLKPIVKNKLYVACTRARNNLYFIYERDFREQYQRMHT
ncbi:MAG: UvrD-helicase domain-containing protein [Bacteroidota bacterium]